MGSSGLNLPNQGTGHGQVQCPLRKGQGGMSDAEKIALLANCVAFAVANLRYPVGPVAANSAAERLQAVDWRQNFLSALTKCGYPANNSEEPLKSLSMDFSNLKLQRRLSGKVLMR